MKAIAALDKRWLEVYRQLAARSLTLIDQTRIDHASLDELIKAIGSDR